MNSTMASTTAADLNVKVFADGADLESIRALSNNPLIKGWTTNPTLMKQASVTDYERFARQMLEIVDGKPTSFEVFSDDFEEMEKQALQISDWGTNVFVKIPVTDTRGQASADLIRRLTSAGVQLNVTAVFTLEQVDWILDALAGGPASYVSIFAGRIADAGVDPVPTMREALVRMQHVPLAELIWASPREILNIVQADEIGCHVITVTHDLLRKLPSLGKDLDEFSLDTVKMFRDDAIAAGYSI
jgi:transaldolase